MMQRSLARWLSSGLLAAVAVVILLVDTDLSSARSPRQEGNQPDFTVSVQSSPDGSATIESQETRLGPVYFAGHGVMEGVTIIPAGLALAEGQVSGVYTSGVIRSPLAVTTDIAPLWAAEAPETAGLRLETRLSFDGGESWSDWLENPEAFYPVRDNLHGGNLIWADGEQVALQFRATLRAGQSEAGPILRSIILVFNDTSRGPTDGDIAAQMAEAQHAQAGDICPAPKPAVVSRSGWGCPDGQDSPHRPPLYQPVTHVILHQTETPNQAGPYHDWAGWVRSVWHYHAHILWWGDVGYNYLIDPNGVIYEGRAGGDDVIGIHDTHNRGSMAIGFLGCYGNCDDPRLGVAEPSQVMLDSAEALIAWKLGQKEIDPLSSADYDGLSNIPVIAGGRDVVATTSPGDNLYNRLPPLREAVAERVRCPHPEACQIADIIFDQAEYVAGDTINMTVRLVDVDGVPLGGAEVTAGVEPPAAAALATNDFGLIDRTGDYDGSYSETETPGDYLFTFSAVDPDETRFAPCSAQATVTVKPAPTPLPCQIELTLGKTEYQAGETVAMTATVTGGPGAAVAATVAGPDKPLFGPFGLAGANPYTGLYTDTTPAGNYLFTATASDPTGQNFLACTAEETVQVVPVSTGPIVRVLPDFVSLPVCTAGQSSTISVKEVAGLRAVDLEIRYDPGLMQVLDANPNQPGVQVGLGDGLLSRPAFVAKNEVDSGSGIIRFAATLLGGDLINGGADLVVIDWRPQAVGQGQILLNEIILVGGDGQAINAGTQNGSVLISPDCQAGVIGKVVLQGRSDYSGVVVRDEAGLQVRTGPDGAFSISSSGPLSLGIPGYLSAQAVVETRPGDASGAGPVDLGQITLAAGDVTADNVINIFDLAYLASRFHTNDLTADLNADGVINILDLAMAAGNYRQEGPLTGWQ